MKLPVASFSFLNTWNICPHQAARRYIVKDLPREPESPEMAWGNEVHSTMENRLNGIIALPESMQAFEQFCTPLDGYRFTPELKLGMTVQGKKCDFFADDVFLRGKLDVPIVLTHTALLLDWKTGKKREDPYELEVGALLVQAQWPHAGKIIGQYVWLKDLTLGETHDLSRTDRTWQRVTAAMSDVERAMERGAFIKTPGPLCGWCSVMDCEHNRKKK
jgi:PD-(D/E)XK nuclease superfamily